VIVAANRGRTVYSTVHAMDAASTPASLEALGVDMRKLAGVLSGIVAQRLLRRTCTECHGSGSAPASSTESADGPEGPVNLDNPAGVVLAPELGAPGAGSLQMAVTVPVCPLCHGSTFYGRVAVREVIKISPAIREAIRLNASATEIAEIAHREGTTSMTTYADQLVADGVTTDAEVKGSI
jgi:type II secretory ATPase GspE/PulE/Tfp pilus assembly ATPase PilB-like protein